MKQLTTILSLLNGTALAGPLRRQRQQRNTQYQRKMWNPNLNNNGRRRKKNNGNNGKLEINKATGGFKQVYNNSRIQFQTIEFYSGIALPDPDYNYIFTGINYPEYDISATLNDNDEFLELRKRALQYKVLKIAMSFNYNRIPGNNDKFSKMIVTPETDMVLQVQDPKINRNSMVWDMSSNGNKNYSFTINQRNTEKINQEWQIGESQWNAICKIKLSSQGDNYIHKITGQTSQYVLGEIKFSVLIKYIQTDMPQNQGNRVATTELIKYIKEDNEIKIKQRKKEMKQEQLKKDIEKLKAQLDDNKLNKSF